MSPKDTTPDHKHTTNTSHSNPNGRGRKPRNRYKDMLAWRHEVRNSDLPAPAKNVLVAILEYCRPGKAYAWPSKRSLATDTGYSLRTVRRAIKTAEAAGWVIVEAQHHEKDPGQTSNLYTLCKPKPQPLEADPPRVTLTPPPCHSDTPPVSQRHPKEERTEEGTEQTPQPPVAENQQQPARQPVADDHIAQVVLRTKEAFEVVPDHEAAAREKSAMQEAITILGNRLWEASGEGLENAPYWRRQAAAIINARLQANIEGALTELASRRGEIQHPARWLKAAIRKQLQGSPHGAAH